MKIFLFYFEMAIKITGSAQNYRVGRVSGNTPIFFRPKYCLNQIHLFQFRVYLIIRKVIVGNILKYIRCCELLSP